MRRTFSKAHYAAYKIMPEIEIDHQMKGKSEAALQHPIFIVVCDCYFLFGSGPLYFSLSSMRGRRLTECDNVVSGEYLGVRDRT